MTDTTTSPSAAAADEPGPVQQAIDALTLAARGTQTVGRGTSSEHTEPVDFAGMLADVLASVAANVGGIEELLVGRSGSWEADLVRQLLRGTVGDDDADLRRWRTELITTHLRVDDVFDDFGLAELYEEAEEELGKELDAAEKALLEAGATEAEQARVGAIYDEINTLTLGENTPRIKVLWEELDALTGPARERAAAVRPDLAERRAAADSAIGRLHGLLKGDKDEYTWAYLDVIRDVVHERGFTVDVAVNVTAPHPGRYDPLAEEIEEAARARTPLPMTGAAPDFSDGSPADAVRRAGATYIERLSAER